MVALLEQLLQSPRLKFYAERITEQLRLEEDARRNFRARSLAQGDWRAEFINGEVVEDMSNKRNHSKTVQRLERALSILVEQRNLGEIHSEQSLTEFSRNDYLPDICFWRAEKADAFTGDTFVYPVPDFVIEVLSDSAEPRDRGIKFEDYAAQGVEEYWIVDPDRQTIEQYCGQNGEFVLKARGTTDATIHGIVLDFDFPVKAAFDDAANLDLISRLLKG